MRLGYASKAKQDEHANGRWEDQEGNISLPFNTAGMYRGYVDSTGQPVIKIYK